MTMINDLKSKFDKQSISEIEHNATGHISMASSHRKEFILALYYLHRTGRFRENPAYKKSTFEQYIYLMFNLRMKTFEKERFAFISAPKESEVLGVGLINKIKEECGAENVPKVAKEMIELKKKSPEAFDKIIAKHAKSVKTKPEIPVDRVEMKDRMEIAEYIKQDTENQKRIKKLIDAVKIRDAEIIDLKNENAKLASENKGLREQIASMNSAAMGFLDSVKKNKNFIGKVA